MGTYHSPSTRPEMPSFRHRTRGPAAWGGIGCLMAILLPILAYFAALLTFQVNASHGWVPIPPELTVHPGNLPISWAILIVAIAYFFLFYGLYSVLYALLYRMLGITPYTPLDLERPPRYKIPRRHKGSALMNVLLFLVSLASGVAVVQMDLSHGWIPLPIVWRLPGPLPYAGVYLLAFLVIWAFLWTVWSTIQGLLSALLFRETEDHDSYGEF